MLTGNEPGLRPAALAPGDYAFVRVTDTGPGMSADVVERIFDPFFTTKKTGHGLGLSTSLGVLKRHEGGIRVDSRPGRGTTFEVFLPLSRQKPLQAAPGPGHSIPSNSTILVVDDEPAVCMVVQRILESVGVRVLVAKSGAEAVSQAEAHAIDAAIVDGQLPRERGLDIAGKLVAIRPGLRVLFSSGYQESPAPALFLAKPYTSRELLDAVGALFREPATRIATPRAS
jgi:CheY-like chemotaxis protein